MRIGLKLTAAFLGIASLVAAAGYIAQRTGRELKQQMERLSQSAIRQMASTTELTVALYAERLAAHESIAPRRRPGGGALEPAPAARSAGELTELARSLEGPSAQELQRELARHQELMDRFRALLDDDADAAERFLEDRVCRHFEEELFPRLRAIRRRAESESTGGIRGAERALVVADQRRGLLLVATAAVAVSIGLIMSRSIGKPLHALQQAAQEIGRGRLDTRVAIGSRDEVGALAASLNGMAAQLREKTVSKDYVDNIIRSMQEMLIVADPDRRIRLANPAACSELGYAADELLGRPLESLLCPHEPHGEEGRSPSEGRSGEGFMQTKSGGRIPVLFSAAEMGDVSGAPAGVVCVALNVSRQKDTEDRLRASLREKDVLLKEVHHRVKNNLQIISSLLSLQAQGIGDRETARLFEESQARVRSMALIHEQLYRSEDVAHVNFAAYVRELIDNVQQGFGGPAARIAFRLDVEPVPLPLDLAIPCGMIVNELVANALEHAFPDDRPGEIRVGFGREGEGYCITIADNGVGMHGGPAPAKATSIGLKVVEALARQLHGRLERADREGTVVTIRFDDPEPKPPSAEEP
jgi:PAS domain S-box-containing protein